MSHFKPNDFGIKNEGKVTEKAKIVKINGATEPSIQGFEYKALSQGVGKYSEIKAKYGSLAATDAERVARATKDARFSLSPLLRDPLAVEEEERRVIDEKVRARGLKLAEEAKAEAIAVGYRDGMKKGHEEAFAKFQEAGAQRLESFTQVLEAVESAKEQIFLGNERFLIELIYKISRMLLLKELAVDREYVQRLAKDLIERVGVRENITIRISERDAETAGMLKEGLEKSLGTLKNLNIQVSNQIQFGGCVVETEWNAIDASVDRQLEGLYESLMGPKGMGEAVQKS